MFDEIANVLTEASDGLLEIELLGSSHGLSTNTTVLRDGNAIAISKLHLIQGFIAARTCYLANAERNAGGLDQEVLRATSVMLLMDPEHLTAANARKRFIRRRLDDEHDDTEILRREKRFIDSLLTSRLHRHTKSPTLWSHRRWLMQQFGSYALDIPIRQDLTSIVMVSGERHPRNYYAWCHARYLTKVMVSSTSDPDEDLLQMTMSTKGWCFAHHNDISGWQFLIFLLEKLPQETSSVFQETLKLATSFKWRNESVWYFLRHIARLHVGLASTDLGEFENLRMNLWETAGEDGHEQKTLERAKGGSRNKQAMTEECKTVSSTQS